MIVTVLGRRGSRSRNTIAEALGAGKATASSVRSCRDHRFVINWGCSQYPRNFSQRSIVFSNDPNAVSKCVNKVYTLNALWHNHVPAIDYWCGDIFDDAETPNKWLEEDGKIVVRHTVTGHSGQGIEIVRRGTPIPHAPLYTRYFRKDAEYRVHVFYGNVILIQQKRRMREENRNLAREDRESSLIRSHHNGWVFTINNLDCDSRSYRTRLQQLGIDAANAVGANHCAVDILVNHDTDTMVVCEINSAPGLEAESSRNAWVGSFRTLIEQLS